MEPKLRQIAARFRRDDSGSVEAAGYIFLVTVMGIGIVVGLATFRDQVVQEFGDIAEGIEEIDQSYSVTYFNGNGNVFKTIVFNEDNPPAPVAGPTPIGATSESGGMGSGMPPAGLSFVPASSESQ